MDSQQAYDLTNQLATKFLPEKIAADRRLSQADVRVIAIIAYDVERRGGLITDMSVPEIANRAAVSERQVQKTVNKLSAYPFQLVERTERPIKPYNHSISGDGKAVTLT